MTNCTQLITISCLLLTLTNYSFAKRSSRVKTRLSNKLELKSMLLSAPKSQNARTNLIEKAIMPKVALQTTRVSSKEVDSFLKTTSKEKGDVQAFYEFILKSSSKKGYQNISSIFSSWVVLNTININGFQAVSPRHLANVVRNFSKKELIELNSVFDSSIQKMKENPKLSADEAFIAAMKEQGVKPEKLRKCKR